MYNYICTFFTNLNRNYKNAYKDLFYIYNLKMYIHMKIFQVAYALVIMNGLLYNAYFALIQFYFVHFDFNLFMIPFVYLYTFFNKLKKFWLTVYINIHMMHTYCMHN